MVKVKVKKLHSSASIPKKGSDLAGGWDVVCTEMETEGNSMTCKLGFSLEIPNNYKMTIVPRSNLTKTNWLINNSPGLIDSDYRGEISVKFRCIPSIRLSSKTSLEFSYEEFPYSIGDRVAQIYLEEVINMEFEEVNKLGETNRGSGGFGSTGLN